MSDIEFEAIDGIAVGAVGPPGKRVFYLQVWAGGSMHSLKLEKQQVAALGAAITELLADVVVDETIALPAVTDPGAPDWVVGTMGLTGFDEATGRVTLVLDEFVREEDAPLGRRAQFGLTMAQLAALSVGCDEAVSGGRPPCPLCSRPMDPEGHVCPKTNGSSKH